MATEEAGESALIVPVDVPMAVRRLRDRMDPMATVGVPAHITLLYPFVPPDGVDEGVRAQVSRIVAGEADERTGLRRLYVCLTRAVTSLAVLHSEDLPEVLEAPRAA